MWRCACVKGACMEVRMCGGVYMYVLRCACVEVWMCACMDVCMHGCVHACRVG